MSFSGNARPPRTPTPPQGETVAAYATYLEAQKAVDHLADKAFPVQLVTIVGTDLRMVERVTGRLSYPRAALGGFLSGAWFGLFVGLLLSLFSSPGAQSPLVPAIFIGGAFGLLFSVAHVLVLPRAARLHVDQPDRRVVLRGAVPAGAGAQGARAAARDRRRPVRLAGASAGAAHHHQPVGSVGCVPAGCGLAAVGLADRAAGRAARTTRSAERTAFRPARADRASEPGRGSGPEALAERRRRVDLRARRRMPLRTSRIVAALENSSARFGVHVCLLCRGMSLHRW